MTSRISYRCELDTSSGLWRITSPSGHVLYESNWRVHVARVCDRLNGHFAEAAERRAETAGPVLV